ncbi:MAG: hypothetical protein RLZ69_189 [Actinomycetota bacterium]|jgi:hypothetical protein
MATATTTGVAAMFKKVLGWGALLIAAIAVIASLLGSALAGINGLISALIGAAIAFAFVSLTALSVWLGGKLNLGGFYGVVLGGWILKVLIFLIIVGVLRHADFINGPTLFFTLVASILGSLGIDSWVFLKARLPIEA